MRISKIIIENFRGLKRAVLKDCADLNVLLGPNGCGKSSVLEALYLASAAFGPSGPIDRLQKRAKTEVVAERRDERVFDEAWQYRYKSGSRKGPTVEIGLLHPQQNICVRIDMVERQIVGEVVERRPELVPLLPLVNADAPLIAFGQGITMIDASFLRKKDFEVHLWPELERDRSDKKLTRMFNNIYGLGIEDFSFAPYPSPGRMRARFPEFPLKIDDLGAGMRIAFRLLLACLLSSNTAVLCEEVDAYQHRSSLESLAKAIVSLSKDNDLQFFFTTHSLESCEILAEAAQEKQLTACFYTLSLGSDGVLVTRQSELESARCLLAAGADLRKD